MKSIVTSIAVGSLLSAAAMAQPHYTVTDLGTLPGGSFSQASFVNNSGVVTGVATAADGTQHSVLWLGGRLFDITPRAKGQNSEAFSFNQWGQASVQAEVAAKDPNNENFCAYGSGLKCLPFLWLYGAMIPLPTLGGNNGSVGNINNRGLMAGYAENTRRDPECPPGVSLSGTGPQVLDFEAVIWGPGINQVRELRPLPGDTVGAALWINDDGQAVGMSGSCANTEIPPIAFGPHAVLWDRDGTPTDLGNLGAAVLNVGLSINSSGQVVGFSSLTPQSSPFKGTHAFLWTKGTGMRDLGTLPGDVVTGGASINDRSQVVGPSFDPDGNPRAFLWQNGVMSDLNALAPDSTLYLLWASAINSSGQIAGFGATSTGDIHGFLATPANGRAAGQSVGAESEGGVSPMVLPEDVRKLIRQRLPSGLGVRK
jgi:probable HAF family extracellular repeat protein